MFLPQSVYCLTFLSLLFRCCFFACFVCFSSLGSPATFFTRERVACLYGCTTLVFDYLYELRAIDRWRCRVRTLIVHGWREIHLGRRVVCVEAGIYWRKVFGSTFTKMSICLLCCFLHPTSWSCFSEGKWFSLQAMNRFTLSSLAFRFGSAEFVLAVSPFLLFPVGVSICITSHPRSYKTLLWYRR